MIKNNINNKKAGKKIIKFCDYMVNKEYYAWLLRL